ncbi:MAG TPA: iron-containing alcohol dehydrogenase [Roseateles sp.]
MAQILYVTRIELAFGACALLPAECERAGMRCPLVITDAGVRAAGVLDLALAAFTQQPPVFDRTPPNPTEAAVRLAVQVVQEFGCDGLVAIGGGSSMDLAKGVAIAATHEGSLKRWATIEGGAVDITSKVLPVICVPTTAGTGSEVARGAILIVDDGRKLGFHNWALLPKAAICDPALTLALPPQLTAATGMDAIAHCIETFLAPAFNPPADGVALEGLRRGWGAIERATRDGQDRDARLDMMCASVHGALAFQKGLGAVHSLSHSLGGLNPRLHHGTLNAVFLPAVIRFNAEADSVKRERRIARLAQAMDLPGSDADAVAGAIAAMNARLGLPAGLAAMGVGPDMDARIVEHALLDHCHKTNPRIASAEDYIGLLAASR